MCFSKNKGLRRFSGLFSHVDLGFTGPRAVFFSFGGLRCLRMAGSTLLTLVEFRGTHSLSQAKVGGKADEVSWFRVLQSSEVREPSFVHAYPPYGK